MIKKIVPSAYFIAIFIVIFLHGFIRIPQTFFPKLHIAQGFWGPSINLATGKGFTSDPSYMNSPEIRSFLGSCSRLKRNPPPINWKNTLEHFTDYEVKTQILRFPDSIGYSYFVGLIWKYFGLNWYYVSLLNYIFSLLAISSLMLCSYKILGRTCALFVGVIYSLSMPEVWHINHLGRDGIPLWFASYLICSMVFLFYKSLTIKRVFFYSLLNGFLVFLSVQGRSSTVFFIPILIFSYFIIIFFTKISLENFKRNLFSNQKFYKESVYFLLALSVTVLSFIVLKMLFSMLLPPPYCSSFAHTMHVIFLGLGVWGQEYQHPSQCIYWDHMVKYQASEYSLRNFNLKTTYLGENYGSSLVNYYIDFVKTYPAFWFENVLLKSNLNTLLHLGYPRYIPFITNNLIPYSFLKIFITYIYFIAGFFGAIFLFFKDKMRFLLFILLSFAISNALMSFLQYGSRHALMGYPAYYLLTSIAFTWGVSSIYKFLFKNNFNSHNEILESKTKRELLFFSLNQQGGFSKTFKKVLVFMSIATVFYILLYTYFSKKEEENIRQMINYFSALKKYKLKVETKSEPLVLSLPPETKGKTVGIYCKINKTDVSYPVTFTLFPRYKRTLKSKVGSNVFVFMPSFNRNITIDNSHVCDEFYWSDLSKWKGVLWEGSYNITTDLEIKN